MGHRWRGIVKRSPCCVAEESGVRVPLLLLGRKKVRCHINPLSEMWLGKRRRGRERKRENRKAELTGKRDEQRGRVCRMVSGDVVVGDGGAFGWSGVCCDGGNVNISAGEGVVGSVPSYSAAIEFR
ncbi:hypothetical protein E2C01_095891 [Portunus trituberculatus]|uniref:Uncharacterized protein n=1 Tax=Portunus trituberculatus TaxID=210409 RepID=A0A5B7K086_PORTR|nr:hypothetical protein [Portunus trituberculatus]